MKTLIFFLILLITNVTSQAQNSNIPAGTIPACGTGNGYYKPQPRTLTSGFPPRIVRNPGTYYAPSGSKQKNWNQYYPKSNTYGTTEPNPFNSKGKQSITRTIRHLYVTRVRN